MLVSTIPVSCAASVDQEMATPPVAATTLCLSNQSSALLRFKHSIQDFLLPGNLSSWRGNGSDCCRWEGVTCDNITGFVIALEIPGVTLFYEYLGSIHSSLFELKRLRHLDLSFNSFNGAIPKRLGELTHLTHLDLSGCRFSGQVPVELSQMTRLVSLNLSYNLSYNDGQLDLQEPNFTMLVRGLPRLQHLQLDFVGVSMGGRDVGSALSSLRNLQTLSLSDCSISSPMDDTIHLHLQSLSHLDLSHNNLQRVPKFLENLTSLNYLNLFNCGLQGQFPRSMFLLPKLETLDISGNELVVSLPTKNVTRSVNIRDLDLSSIKELTSDNPLDTVLQGLCSFIYLTSLKLSNSSLYGTVPTCLFSLSAIMELDLSENSLNGIDPMCAFSSSSLERLSLSYNLLNGTVPTCLFSLSSLKALDLSGNSYNGIDPKYLFSSSSLEWLDLDYNLLNGSIPSSLFSLPSLRGLDIAYNRLNASLPILCNPNSNLEVISLNNNQLSGDVSSFMNKLPSLRQLVLSSNDLSGIINISLLSSLKGLAHLDVSNNRRLRVEASHSNSGAPDTSMNLLQLEYLNLSSCNIQSFPRFICKLPKLMFLDLSDNDAEGKVPSCLWSISELENLVLDQNRIDGFEEPVNITKSIGSQLDFSLTASSNQINGAIPSFFCNLTGLKYLDMSDNHLTGVIPNCLYKLTAVKLRKNQLWGQLPSGFCNMRVLDLNGNFLTGGIPRSLSNCTSLIALDLGNNVIDGALPAWLGQLNNLEVLVLRSNQLYGSISVFNHRQSFPALTILDISTNHFSGTLPRELFEGLKAITHEALGNEDYTFIGYVTSLGSDIIGASYELPGEVEITIKGKVRWARRMKWAWNVIDLSDNNFTGQLPKEIGLLKNLRGLNVSNNNLDGPIPKSFSNLQRMEWLDLSRNHLSGTIPEELVALTFLSFLNLSYNDLQGGIPQGGQFNTFGPSSFEGNPKLCGQQVNITCFDGDGHNVHKQDIVDEREEGEEGWKCGAVGIGLGMGLITITLPILFVQRLADWYWAQTGGIVDFISLQIYALLNFGR